MVAKASTWQGLTPAALLLPVAFPADIQSPRPGNRQAQGWGRLLLGPGGNVILPHML